jgi:hypothetical protein
VVVRWDVVEDDLALDAAGTDPPVAVPDGAAVPALSGPCDDWTYGSVPTRTTRMRVKLGQPSSPRRVAKLGDTTSPRVRTTVAITA